MPAVFNEIRPYLFLTDEEGAKERESLKSLGIRHIVSISDAPVALFPHDFKYLLLQYITLDSKAPGCRNRQAGPSH